MQTITVDKAQLLATLKENRKKHVKEFKEAKANYLKIVAKELAKRLKKVESGKKFHLNFTGLYEPQSHTEDFDRAIGMVEWEQADSIKLSQEDFTRYIQDDWEWKAHFRRMSETYATGKFA